MNRESDLDHARQYYELLYLSPDVSLYLFSNIQIRLVFYEFLFSANVKIISIFLTFQF